MDFDFDTGSCNSFLEPTPINFIRKNATCNLRSVRYNIRTLAFRFDGEQYSTAGSSLYSHYLTLGMANYIGTALTTGCYDSSRCYVKTELMDMQTLKWTDGPDYPFTSKLDSF